MSPILKFTEYNEHYEEFTVDLKITAEFEGEVLEAFSPTIAQSKAVDSVLDKHFRLMVEDIINQALKIRKDKGELELNIAEMLLMDKMSMFQIKQTVGFNTDFYIHCRSSSILLQGIW